ncbi:hypothetical protein F5Y18DRAFT_410659 [Xylariaceae sp. FL1019]|nr:hypothetical protein F5Y18DRAFT_410659 [Xylariaceae sp. FL1019]
MVHRDEILDVDISLRFKHGIQTIFMFVDAMKPFTEVQEELLEVLKERFPRGIISTSLPKRTTELPSHASQIKFATPKSALDPKQGWKPLQFDEEDTPASKNLKDNAILAFAITAEGDDDAEPEWEVEFPGYGDDEEEAGA